MGGGVVRAAGRVSQHALDICKRALHAASDALRETAGTLFGVGHGGVNRPVGFFACAKERGAHGFGGDVGTLLRLSKRATNVGERALEAFAKMRRYLRRSALGPLKCAFHQGGETAHRRFDFLGALDETNGEAAKGRLALIERIGKVGLCGPEQFGRLGEHLRMFVEPADNATDLVERLAGNVRQPVDVVFQQAAGAGDHVCRVSRGLGEAAGG